MEELLSIVVPCYNEETTVLRFYQRITEIIDGMTISFPSIRYEILFIDDGSTDKTVSVMKECYQQDERVRYVILSRNFGKEAAIYAGLQKSKGDYVVTMDVDLQDPPELLPDMLQCIMSGEYDTVATRRVNRKGEPRIRSFFARMFYKIMNRISETEIVDGARDYRMMSRQVVDSVLEIGEYNRFTKGIYGWVGYRTKWLEFEHVERVAGETKWSFWKLCRYAIDGITAYSTVPLAFATFMGILISFAAVLAIAFIIVRKLLFGDPTSGWPSMVCIILFLGGIQLFAIGIIGQYLAKTYLETKKRPIYIAREESQEVRHTVFTQN